MKQALFFDLDGTLTDSSPGIYRSVRIVLDAYRVPYREEDLPLFIGPPLSATMRQFGIPEDAIDDAIALYRKRYNTVGKYENRPYEGVREMLQSLRQAGFTLYVATSKPEQTAIDVLAHFELLAYFERVVGATFDRRRESKEDVLACLLELVPSNQSVMMIGDTAFDVRGAACFKIPAIGVSWGFGDVDEMREAGAVAIVDSPQALCQLLIGRKGDEA